MSILRNTFYKKIPYWSLVGFQAILTVAFLSTTILMTKFYVQMRNQKIQISNVLKLYQISWIFCSFIGFLCVSLRNLELFDVSGLSF